MTEIEARYCGHVTVNQGKANHYLGSQAGVPTGFRGWLWRLMLIVLMTGPRIIT